MSRHTRRTFLKVSGSVVGGIAMGATVTAATRSDRFIVDTTDVSKSALDGGSFTVVSQHDEVGFAVVAGDESAVNDVTSAYEPDLELSLDAPSVNAQAPEDTSSARDEPYYPIQWDKQAQDIPDVQDVTRGEGTRVAVIDSGVTATHPDLEHAVNTDLSGNFTGDGLGAGRPYGGYHGTHVAGIIAANDDNQIGVVGSAPETEIVDCRVFPYDSESASFAAILSAMLYSAEIGCDAANLSLGAYPIPRQANGSFYGSVLNRTTTHVNSRGTLLVVAAGNDAADLQHDKNLISLPNETAQAVSVSATGPIGFNWGADGLREGPKAPAVYTNYGTNAVTLAAPGGNYDPEAANADTEAWYYDLVFNTIGRYTEFHDDGTPVESSLETGYAWLAGTSMAAPQVTAAAALVKSVNPGYDADDVEATLKRTASVPDGADKSYYGAGFVDPLAAVRD